MCILLLFGGENRHSVLCVVFFCLEVRINTLYCVYSSFCLAASDTVWESVFCLEVRKNTLYCVYSSFV